MSRVVLRTLRSPAEFRMAQDVAQRAWGWPDRDLPPITDLVATAHVGGVVAGAFEGREMLGFAITIIISMTSGQMPQ